MKTLGSLKALLCITLLGLSPVIAQAQAPDSIAGLGIQITITSGTKPPFDNTGSGSFYATYGGTYSLMMNGEASSGTYTYSKTSASSATINLTDNPHGNQEVVVLTFSSATTGTFTITMPSYPGAYASGPFVIGSSYLPGTATLLTPEDGASLTDPHPLFSWLSTDPSSSWYHIYLQRNGSKCLEQWIQGTRAWFPPDDLAGGSYTWWVQGWNSYGVGPWSQGFHFTLPSNVPGVLTPVSPDAIEVASSTVQYTWTVDTNATWYLLSIMKNGCVFQNKWYASSSFMIDIDSGNFVVNLGGHGGGAYSWRVRGWNADGLGPWSTNGTFTVPDLKPGAVTLLSPSGAQDNTTLVRYTWTAEPKASWYELYLMKNGKRLSDHWYAATESVLDSSTGNFALDLAGHGGGNYQWWARAWSPDGMGPWSGSLSFTVPVQAPGAATLLYPSGSVIEAYPTFQWEAVEGAAWYYLWIQKGSYNYSTWVNSNSWNSAINFQNAPGDYHWWVRAWNEDGLGPWSSSLSFTAELP